LIGIVDYGLGNVQAFANIYRRLGVDASPVQTPSELLHADRLVLPGVGAFDWAMTRLKESGMLPALNQRVLGDGVPVLGVCVGMQMMARRSEEGVLPGLAWIDADVRKFDSQQFDQRTHLPHMGWNRAIPVRADPLFDGLDAPEFYFLHSYFVVPDQEDLVLARTDYGSRFTSAIRRRNIYATQFHPEKSHQWGIRLLKNFSEAPPCCARD
jgi:glutamine amidotransferase